MNSNGNTKFLDRTRSLRGNFKRRNGHDIGLERVRKEVTKAMGKPCRYCGVHLTLDNLGLDHVVSKEDGGNHTWDNLQFICKQCNGTKGSFSHEPFVALLEIAEQYGVRDKLISRLRAANLMFGGR